MAEVTVGPELDAAVAVQVLGCAPREKTPWGYRLPDGSEYVTDGALWSPYSTSIASAWGVLARFWAFSVDYCAGTTPEFTVRIMSRTLEQWEATGTTFPEAACRCALATVQERGR